jgi:hypothetical protein
MINDFIFFIFHVGVIEEIAKFLPVLIIMLILKERVNDPLDLVVYGGLSALGFATLENSLYFSVYGLRIISARFIVSAVGHMAETILLCYLWARARYMKPGNEYIAVLAGFCLVVLSHGLFDFLIIVEIPVLLLLLPVHITIMTYLCGRILNKCVTFSPRSAYILTSLTTRRVNNYHFLYIAACVLLIISYLDVNFTYTTEVANYNLMVLLFLTLLCIGPVFTPLANIGMPPTPKNRQNKKKIAYHQVKPTASSIHNQ